MNILFTALLFAWRVRAQLDDASLGLAPNDFSTNTSATALPVVDLGYAKYEGSRDEAAGVTRFYGIRYAAPPTGDLRWRAPQLPAASTNAEEILKADTLPPMCPGTIMGSAPLEPHPRYPLPTSEDCLFLNVFTSDSNFPSSTTDTTTTDATARPKKPVLVWIHGGGFHVGSIRGYTGQDVFDGQDLVVASRDYLQVHGLIGDDYVVVVPQYRLNVFGFLSSSALKEEGGALNAGLLDQQLALRWIQTHIAKFGGDPDNVTLFGESAGAASVVQHVIANGGATQPPLFHAAMSASYGGLPQYAYDDPIVEARYAAILRGTNCSSLACLRALDVDTLHRVAFDVCNGEFYGTFVFTPVVDGEFIRQRPLKALREGRVNVPSLLATTVTNEGGYFVSPGLADKVSLGEVVSGWFPKLPIEHVERAVTLYEPLGTLGEAQTTLLGEAIFLCPTYQLSAGFNKWYKATLDVQPSGHGADVNYYFKSLRGVFPYITSPPSEDFADAFTGAYMSYVRDRRPSVRFGGAMNDSGVFSAFTRAASTILRLFTPWRAAADEIEELSTSNTIEWPAWTEENQTEMLFSVTEAGEPFVAPVRTDPALMERCRFWGEATEWTQQ
ncbi:Alpha/Beta hydrolase protein [Schizophyllum amplum]|uniref:Carboxylic ester hydrolase n=1 Tax=Schizophyllum amplum TaxID=97359 RepID=A0A550BUP5_9AGAR|nr:Alpha/Beta hydrolase protein [Auriculariopsis ampla]